MAHTEQSFDGASWKDLAMVTHSALVHLTRHQSHGCNIGDDCRATYKQFTATSYDPFLDKGWKSEQPQHEYEIPHVVQITEVPQSVQYCSALFRVSASEVGQVRNFVICTRPG